MSNHLTLWIPGLRPSQQFVSELGKLPKNEIPGIPNLNLILSRAKRTSASDVIEHDFILQQLSEHLAQQSRWPLAQWRLAVEHQSLSDTNLHWLCADPVYLHPDRAEALLFAHEELELELDEAWQLAELINLHYQDEPWELHIGSTHRWYLRLEQAYDIDTHALENVKGKNIFDYLPSGNDARYWQQCMNEMQMLLHSSDINQQREEKGLLPINSLWLWGYGDLPGVPPLHWQKIYSDDAVINGLGILSGSKVADLPDDFESTGPVAGDVLVVMKQLKARLEQGDIFSWLDELQYLEKYWFESLVEKLKSTPDLRVTLLLNKDEAYQFSGKELKRWWHFRNKNKLF